MLTIAAGYEHMNKDLVSELRLNLCYSLNFGCSTYKNIILLAVAVLFHYKSNSFYHNATLCRGRKKSQQQAAHTYPPDVNHIERNKGNTNIRKQKFILCISN